MKRRTARLLRPPSRKALWWSGFLLIATFLAGWYFVEFFARYGESLERRALLVLASTAAASLDPAEVGGLKGTPGDLDTGAFRHVRQSLRQMRAAIPHSRFAYLMMLRNGKLIFLADAEPANSPDYSAPGEIYTDASPALRQVFETKAAVTEGPLADRWGVWVTGAAPVMDPRSGNVVAVFGVDIGAQQWQATIARYRWLGITISGLLAAIVVFFGIFLFREKRLVAKLAAADRIVRSSTTILYRLGAEPSLPMRFVSDNIAKFGFDPAEFLDSPGFYRSLTHPDDETTVAEFLRRATGGTEYVSAQFRIRAKDGSYHWIENRIMPLRDKAGRLLALEGMLFDISEVRLATEKLQFAHTLLKTTMETSPDGILVVDENGRILSFNRRFAAMWKVPIDACELGEDAPILAAVTTTMKDPEEFIKRVQYLYAHPEETGVDDLATKDGRFFERHTEPLRSDAGLYLGRVWFFRDITLRKNAEDKVRHTAHHDGLTGLANRRVFTDEICKAIGLAERGEKGFAVLYLDLDHFKDVNDTLGHPIGDLLLQAVAERMQSSVRETDTVARFGGDEFAVIQIGAPEATDAATLAGVLIKAISEPYSIEGNEIRIGASIGIAMFGPDSQDAETLLSRADVALYRAKAEGRGTYRFFADAMDVEVRTRVALGADLREAIAAGHLQLCYQPQVDIETGRIVGVEALVRWQHPKLGLIMPDAFIPLAEKNGLIVPLGHWVLREACRQTREWLDAGIAVPLMAVNLSALQFKTPHELEDGIAAILTETAVPPQLIELELTESTLMQVSRGHNDVLLRLRQVGLRIAIDDFGTGYSSLEYLGRFPVDRIKIAQNFMLDLTANSRNATIVKAAIGLAHELDLDVVVEGVATVEQVRLIRSWGCRKVQGFYFSIPLSAAEAAVALRREKVLAMPSMPAEAAA